MKRSSQGYGILPEHHVLVGDNTIGTQQQWPLDRRRRRSLQSSIVFTNDSMDVEITDDRIDIRDGYPIRYKCMDSAMATTTGETDTAGVIASLLSVTFSYEFTMRVDGSHAFSDNLKALEWSVLWNIVSNIGLHRCDFQKQTVVMEQVLSTTTSTASSSWSGSNGVRRERRRMQSFNSSLVLSLTSDSIDTIDTDAVRCQNSPPTNQNTICTPMTGNMNMVYTGDDPAMMQRFLMAEIQKVMTSPVVLVQDVGNVMYIGHIEALDGAAVTDTPGQQGNNDSLSALLGVSIGVGILAMSVIVVFVVLGIVRKKRQSEKIERELAHVPSDVEKTDSLSSVSPRSVADLSDEYASSSSSSSPSLPLAGAAILHVDTKMGDGDSLSQAEYEHNGIVYMKHEAAPSESVYLTSNPMHRKRRRTGRRTRQAFRARVAMAPLGIESIPEIPEGDFDVSVEEKEDSPSESEDDEGKYSSPLNTSKKNSQNLSGFSSPKGFQSPGLLPQDGGKPKSRASFHSPGLDSIKSASPAAASDGGWANFDSTIPAMFPKTTPPKRATSLSRRFFPDDSDSPKTSSKRVRRQAEV